MKIGFVSDTHGNFPAFRKVLDNLNSQNLDLKVHLGDIVGYGPFPNECIDATISNFNYIIKGNHDESCVNLDEAWGFNPLAKEAIEWTAKNTSTENKQCLDNLKYGYTTEDGLMFVHGSPADPFGYIVTEGDARLAFFNPLKEFEIAFIGHTHVAGAWILNENLTIESIKPTHNNLDNSVFKFTIPNGSKAIVNVGSVGQPRDLDPRSSYIIYDTETREVAFHRTAYPIDVTVGRMQRYGMPSQLYMRLMQGR